MTAETGTSKTGAVHKYYKCLDKKKTCKCDKQSVPKEKIENFVFEKTKQYVLQPNIIEEIAEVVTQKLNANIFSNIVLDKLKEKLNAKDKAIILILDDIE